MAWPYPLRFLPLFRRYLWGGRRLQSHLGKSLGAGDDYAESWEVVDHGDDQSVVLAGSLQGQTLAAVAKQHGPELFGRHRAEFAGGQFPLLFKFLDCQRTLSVQVHPNDAAAARLDPPDLGKTEAWVILHAEPNSLVYAGLKPGVDRMVLERAVQQGTTEQCLHCFEPQAGDCIFIPAGVVHALGSGLLVAEIQQSSDTTYRLFDWNRVGPDGMPRPLHVAAALDATDFSAGQIQPVQPQVTRRPYVEQLVDCDKFQLNRWQCQQSQTIGGDDRFHMIAVTRGEVLLDRDPTNTPLRRGEVTLIPAGCGEVTVQLRGEAEWLDAYLP